MTPLMQKEVISAIQHIDQSSELLKNNFGTSKVYEFKNKVISPVLSLYSCEKTSFEEIRKKAFLEIFQIALPEMEQKEFDIFCEQELQSIDILELFDYAKQAGWIYSEEFKAEDTIKADKEKICEAIEQKKKVSGYYLPSKEGFKKDYHTSTFLNAIWKSGEIREIRAFNDKGYVFFGYFDKPEKANKAIYSLIKRHEVYITLNPVQPDLLARASNKVVPATKKTKTTSDGDIHCLKYLLIDVDPVRASYISSTDEELKLAKNIAKKIRKELGQPLLIGCSGNGYHLIYPHNAKNKEELKSYLKFLQERYGTKSASIDISVYNPSRITKVLGTWARKGDNAVDIGRPHRQSYTLNVCESPAKLKIPSLEKVTPKTKNTTTTSFSTFDVKFFLENYGVKIQREKEGSGGARIICLKECIFNAEHKEGESSVIVNTNGKICYQCFHNSCQGKTWKEARESLEGPKVFRCKYCNAEIEWLEGVPHNSDGKKHTCKLSQNINITKPDADSELEIVEEKQDSSFPLEKIHPVFKHYANNFRGKTEAPEEFIVASFLGAIAGAVGNKVTLDFGAGNLKSNLYLILIGKSSFSKKTTSLNNGLIPLKKLNKERIEKYLETYSDWKLELEAYKSLPKKQKANTPYPEEPLNNQRIILPEEMTPEALISSLQAKSDAMFVYSEMGILLSKLNSSYSNGLKEMLTHFYDCPDDYARETKKDGFIYIKSPCPTILGASTFQWLQAYLDETDLFSGFLARFCFVVKRGYPQIDIPFPDKINLDSEWFTLFEKLSEKRLELTISKEAKESYSDWYIPMKEYARRSEVALHGFIARLLTTCHKIAMLNHILSVCFDDLADRPKNESIIEAKSYERAYPWIHFFKENVENCVQELTKTENVLEKRVLEIISREKDGIITQSKLLKSTPFKNMSKMNDVMELLIAKKFVQRIPRGTKQVFYKVAKKKGS